MCFPLATRIEGRHEAVRVEFGEGLVEYEMDRCTGLFRPAINQVGSQQAEMWKTLGREKGRDIRFRGRN